MNKTANRVVKKTNKTLKAEKTINKMTSNLAVVSLL